MRYHSRLAARPGLLVPSLLWACSLPLGLAAPSFAQPAEAPQETTPQPAASLQASADQLWSGGVTVPPGAELGMIFKLSQADDGTWQGLLSIPTQNLLDAAVSELVVADDNITFLLALPGMPVEARPSFDLDLAADGTLTGIMTQMGMAFPASFTQSTTQDLLAEAQARRPQTPIAPFPYRTEEVTVPVSTEAGDHTLAGTITLPEAAEFGDGPYPAVVFITGSGAQDRDETLFDHKPFAVLADHLARHGIASLRCDDRGVYGSSGDAMTATTVDFVEDARAQVLHLAARDDIASVGLIGHSEGGVVGPMLAADEDAVDFVVMLAGTGVPGSEILLEQTAAMLAAGGVPDEKVAEARTIHARLFEEIANNAPRDTIRATLTELIQAQSMVPLAGDVLENALNQSEAQINSHWMRAFLKLDPRVALRKVQQPVLVLNGDNDLQVLDWQNIPEIEKALAHNADVTVQVFPGLNHLFQKSQLGTVAEYATIKTTIEPEVLEVVTDWVLRVSAD